MRSVKIITDSASDIPFELFEKYDISMLPMGVVVGEKTYLDRVDLDAPAFYKMMREDPESLPKTVMPSVEMIEAQFEKNLNTFEHQIYVCISSKGSGTYNVASMIKNEIEDRLGRPSNITIIDSMSFSVGYGIAVREMSRLAYEGAGYDTVMEAYRRIMDSMNVYMVVDDLKHLQRGGRINPSVAFVGGMLGIKPLLTIKDGIIDSYGKERGKRRAMEKLIDISVENIKKPDETNVWIVHTDALSDAETMKSMFLERIKPKEVLIIEFGACIGSHTGRGLVGIVFNAAE